MAGGPPRGSMPNSPTVRRSRALEIDGMGALIEPVAAALIGASPPARLRPLEHDDVEPRVRAGSSGGRRGDQAGETSSDNDDVCMSIHA